MHKNRIFYLVFLIVSVLFYIYFPEYLSFVILLFVLLLPVLTAIIGWITSRFLSAELTAAAFSAEKNREICFLIRLTNRSFLPVSGAKLTLTYRNLYTGEPEKETLALPMCGRDGTEVSFRAESRYCGAVVCELQSLAAYDILGLFAFRKKIAHQAMILVLPDVYKLSVPLEYVKEVIEENDASAAQRKGDSGTDVFEVREYAEGDSLHKIHWKLSSKQDKLMVRDFSENDSACATVLLELSRQDKSDDACRYLDTMMDVFASLSAYFVQNRVSFRVVWYDCLNEAMQAVLINTQEELNALMERLLAIPPYDGAPKAVVGYGGYRSMTYDQELIYLTSVYSDRATEILFRECNAKRIHMLYTGGEEIRLENVLHIHNETIEQDLNLLSL